MGVQLVRLYETFYNINGAVKAETRLQGCGEQQFAYNSETNFRNEFDIISLFVIFPLYNLDSLRI